jgi:hypothetical protein
MLLDVARRLEQVHIKWMLVGSWASSAWGRPRFTHDVDMLIGLRAEDIGPLVAAVQDDYYVSEEMLADALVYRTPANLIHLTAAEKVDLWAVGDDEYAAASLARRRRETMWGACVWISAPEDVILAKLRWLAMGDSLQHYDDALGVATVQWGELDLVYLREWAARLGLTESLDKLLAEAEQAAG